jgi:carbon monoxide dehydrogenase subunit G
MHTVLVSSHVNATPDQVWSKIGDPAGISAWHPVIATSPMEGDTRVCTLADGAVITEEVETVDKEQRSMTYRITEGPLPVAGFSATLRVVEEGRGSALHWSASFDVAEGAPAPEVVGMVQHVYQAGLDALRTSYA